MVNVITVDTDKGLLTYIIQFLASSTLKTNDGRTDAVFDFEDALDQTEMAQLAVNELKKIPEVNVLFKERWLPTPFNLDELSQLPEGTLGHVYAHKIKSEDFNPYFYKTVPVVDDISYLKMLWRTTHDIYHVVAGFDTDEIGEIGLQAFFIAQTPIPISAMIVSFGLVMISLYQPHNFKYLMSEISRGYNLGSQTQGKLIAQKWDKYWDVQVSDIRANLGMKTIL
ncbi:Coq4 family protein [Nodularia spumigena CS-586/05]|uniref:Coq4 family protein n=1 Tax=Cyanophyceae TaxID=3028117 RepID=UPI00232B1C4D|nr:MULTISPECIES: Coq4 family protein [Cyanophyceae]MDB9339549.1 Coq4 family protein [Nodularia spumigena CS-589/07]MDB9345863.1 Coq4 family protein [Nodularia spumigena CS-588/06]MDB9371320.1 Coq4 family protein [Nodularia spumigena CS-586/05]MDB9400661.1 Coq4 family protein [Microcystis aeruginosa CS-567/02-A1]MDB9533230.1 Coq4 family protein [Nodularia spumigena CS-1038]